MDETKVLEKALENCQTLERSIYESIRLVRRLNIRYNSDWLLKNYKNYMANIWSQYRCKSPEVGARRRSCEPAAAPKLSSTRLHSSTTTIASTQTPRQTAKCQTRSPKAGKQQPVNARSSNELCGSNRKINYKFIRIKRSMEALIMQIQHAIEISNRQKNYTHVNVSGRDSRTRICCH